MTNARSGSIAAVGDMIAWCCRRGISFVLIALSLGCAPDSNRPHITAPDLPIPIDTTRIVRLQRVEVTTVTTGVRLDPDGYGVLNDYWGYDVGDGATVAVPTNGTVTLLLAPREHLLSIVDVAANCTGENIDDRPITVPAVDDSVTRVVFHLMCGP